MIKKSSKTKVDQGVYEHLDHYLKKTTYADRLRWLERANAFVNEIERRRKKGTLFKKMKKKSIAEK